MYEKYSMPNFAKQEPWWDSECEQLKKDKFKALRFFLKMNPTVKTKAIIQKY